VLTCLFSVKLVRTICGGESGSQGDRLRPTSTAALLTTAYDEGAHLGIWGADQRSDTERSADLCRTDNEVFCSNLSNVYRALICRLHRINHERAAT
jgi:hypothetical protein